MRRKYEAVEGVADSADFGPYYEGESFVTITFRVPIDTQVPAGVWKLQPLRPLIPNQPEWSKDKAQKE